MNGRKRIIVIMILLFGLLMTTGVSTWIITSQVTFAPGYYDGPTVTYITPKFAGSSIDVSYNELTDGKSYSNLNTAVISKATTVNTETNTSPLSFTDESGNAVALSYGEDKDYTFSIISFNDGTTTTGSSSTAAIGSTYQCTATFTLTADARERYTLEKNQATTIVKYQTCQIGSDWYTIEDALATGGEITLQTNGTLSQHTFCNLNSTKHKAATDLLSENYDKNETKSYEIKSGTTLTLPYDADGNTNVTNRTFNVGNNASINNTALKKNELLFLEDLALTNRGAIVIGGSTTGSNGGSADAGRTTGDYSQITLVKKSNIISYGNITVWGFLAESETKNGSFINMEEGILKIPFVVLEHRGGSTFAGMYKDLKCAPFNRFYMENIYCNLTLNSKASLVGHGNMYASSKDNTTDIHLVGNSSDGNTDLLELASSSYLIAKYDKVTQTTDLDLYGDIDVKSLSLSVSGQNISTRDVLFPLSYLYDVSLNSTDGNNSTVSLGTQSIKLLPGAILTVGDNVTLDASNASIAVYKEFSDLGINSSSKYPSNKNAAELIVNGNLIVKNLGGFVTTEQKNNETPANLQITNSTSVVSPELESSSGSSFLTTVTYTSGSGYGTTSLNGNLIQYIRNGTATAENDTGLSLTSYQSVCSQNDSYWAKKDFAVYINVGTDTPIEKSSNGNAGIIINEDDYINDIPENRKMVGDELYFNQECTIPYIVGIDVIYNNLTLYMNTIYSGYQIKYITSGGEDIPDTEISNDDINSLNFNLETEIGVPQRTGYDFVEWTLDGEPKTTITKDTFGTNTSITLVAKWKQLAKVTIINNVDHTKLTVKAGGNVIEDGGYVREGQFITVDFSAESNYTLNNGSYTISNGTVEVNNQEYEVQEDDTEIIITVSGTTASSGGGGCLDVGSLITLADGSQKKIEDLTGEEMLLVWNTFTGQFESAPILFVDSEPLAEYRIVNLNFADGTTVKVIYEHGFFDVNLNKYVYIDEYNASEFIGHEFIKQTYDENGNMVQIKVALESVEVTTEQTTAWSPVTYQHLCYYVDGMLSMPGGIEGLFNIFEIDPETMTIDKEQMAKDIEKYGLFTYEEFNAILPLNEVMFEVFNGEYLKVAIGKGLITWERLEYLANRYSVFFEEQ